MDLEIGAREEAFRAEVRDWLAVALELARPLLYGAAVAAGEGAGPAERDAAAAKIACAQAANRAARAALQVYGALGYTRECDLGLWLTRVRALMSAWGSIPVHRARLRASLLAAPSI